MTYSIVRPVFRAIVVSLYPRLFQSLNVVKQINGSMLTACDIFYQTHHHTVFVVRDDLRWQESHAGRALDTLLTDPDRKQVVSWAVGIFLTGDCDWPLQANSAMFSTISLKIFLVANTRVDHGNAVDWYHLHRLTSGMTSSCGLQERCSGCQSEKCIKGLESIGVEPNTIIFRKPEASGCHVDPR